MVDKTDEQIMQEREHAINVIKERYQNVDDVEIIDSFIEHAPKDAKPLWYISKSIKFLCDADLAYFIGDWKKYRGCKAENYLAREYGIEVIEE